MKPRIVREWLHWPGECPGSTLDEAGTGPAYLALPWPEDCPYTPEQVMAACERQGAVLVMCPYEIPHGEWWAYATSKDWTFPVSLKITPEFMGEKCEHKSREYHAVLQDAPSQFCKCSACGAILSDRRHGERRVQERRKVGCITGGGRRGGYQLGGFYSNRRGFDRRKP